MYFECVDQLGPEFPECEFLLMELEICWDDGYGFPE